MLGPSRIDFILSTLSATEIGSLATIIDKLDQVRSALNELGQPELESRVREAAEALARGDVAEFKRIRAYLQAKVGHLR